MVNRARLKAVEKKIAEIDDSQFVMERWAQNKQKRWDTIETEADGTPAMCNTAFCIGGLAVMMYGTEEEKRNLVNEDGVWGAATRILGLTYSQADSLFIESFWKIKSGGTRKQVAIKNIRRLRSWNPFKWL